MSSSSSSSSSSPSFSQGTPMSAPEARRDLQYERVTEVEAAADCFNPLECLFCNIAQPSLSHNIAHMQQSHGLFIPSSSSSSSSSSSLAVDLDVLLEYLHLVINEYLECIYCGTSRATSQAVKQHMIGKGHCKFDITDPESEYRDFFDSGSNEGNEEGEKRRYVQLDETSIRLPSGKTLGSRPTTTTVQRTTTRRPFNSAASEHTPAAAAAAASLWTTSSEEEEKKNPRTAAASGSSSALTKADKRGIAFATQLSQLSRSDQTSLAHLAASEQRAVLATRQKQLEKAQRVERRLLGRLQSKTNKTAMKHFVNDVPGPKCG